MLEELRIQNLGVIADATLPLDSGLTCITGETGAGKTMVVAGLGLLFGGRAPVPPSAWNAPLWRAASPWARPRSNCVSAPSRPVPSLEDDGAAAGPLSVLRGPLAGLGRRQVRAGRRARRSRRAGHLGARPVRPDAPAAPAEQRAALDRFAGADHEKLLDAYREAFPELARPWSKTGRPPAHAPATRHQRSRPAPPGPRRDHRGSTRSRARTTNSRRGARLEHAEGLRRPPPIAYRRSRRPGRPGRARDATPARARPAPWRRDARADPRLGELAERLAEAGHPDR